MLCVLTWSHVASAHSPLARSVLVADNGALYVYAAWSGVVLRTDASEPFTYACDTAFGVTPSFVGFAWAPRADGSLILGNAVHSLRIVAPDACSFRVPSDWPTDVGIAALESDGTPDGFFAITTQEAPTLLHTSDGGETWEAVTQLDAGASVTGMQVMPQSGAAPRVYLTRASGPTDTLLMFSSDGGATFTTTAHGADLSLVDARAGTTDELWLLTPRRETNELAIVRGVADASVFEEVHRVRFFGGLALSTSDDRVWIADEAGSLVRSDDGGATFEAIQTDLAIACLVHKGDTLWACASGTQEQPALTRSADGGDTFETVMSFGSVDRLHQCEGSQTLDTTCGSEWYDWQRDVLPQPDAGTDAGIQTDAGTPRPASRDSRGCSVQRVTRPGGGALVGWLCVLLWLRWPGQLARSAQRRLSRRALR